jgi:hypothetical protein
MYQNFHLPKGQKGKIQNLTDLLSGICEWQEKYDRRLKAGQIEQVFGNYTVSKDGLLEILNDKNKQVFSKDVIYWTMKDLLTSMNDVKRAVIREIKGIKISDEVGMFSSTKGILDAELLEKKVEFSKTQTRYYKESGVNVEEYTYEAESNIKVHDAVMHFMVEHDLSSWKDVLVKISENNFEVRFSFCEKGQRGGDREIYRQQLLMKFGNKYLESIFQILGRHLDWEAETIPGDYKHKDMMEMMNAAMKHHMNEENMGDDPKIFFFNRDATKWSPCSVLGEYIPIIHALGEWIEILVAEFH